ncbi:MAG: sulfatase-like hydrolase/transferase, partial [Deltaproteobacteria bacterium]|nr:sulfatase-like hydrolase/transferase [Deltaproteobacteria bacterium]
AAAIVVAYLYSTTNQIDGDIDGGIDGGNNETRNQAADSRPVGSIEDVAKLRERDDLNVLFILIDTLRSDRLGSYGYSRDTSPFLDRLANTGVRFGRHLSQSSWTKASMTSLWSSVYPWRTGVTRFDHIIPEDAELAAETLCKGLASELSASGATVGSRPPSASSRASTSIAGPARSNSRGGSWRRSRPSNTAALMRMPRLPRLSSCVCTVVEGGSCIST